MISRLYSAAFDTVRQADARADAAERQRFIGRLRLSCLVSGALVVTDVQVLDGAMLLELGPVGLRELLGADPGVVGLDRVVVTSRCPDLGQSLLEMLRDPSPPFVKGFLFSSLGLTASAEADVAARLRGEVFSELVAEAASVGQVRAVAQLLRRCGAPEEKVASQERSWRVWVDETRAGRVPLAAWGTAPSWSDLLREAPWEELGTLSSAEKQLVGPWREAPFDRSRFYRWVESEALPPASALRLRAWYDDVYHRGIARQHGASYIALVESGQSPDASAVQDEVAERRTEGGGGRVALPQDVLDGLGVMPGVVFDAARFGARAGIESWLRGEHDGMRRVAYALETALEQPDPRAERRQAVVVLMLGAAAALLAAAVLLLHLDGEVAVVLGLCATAAGLLGSGLRDLALLRRTGRGRLAAVVDVRGVARG